jgi:hypothetical protein
VYNIEVQDARGLSRIPEGGWTEIQLFWDGWTAEVLELNDDDCDLLEQKLRERREARLRQGGSQI